MQYVPGSEMQDIEEGGDGIASRLTNLRLLNQRLVEERSGILLLLLAGVAAGVFALRLLLCCHAGDVESHLDELVLARAGFLALATRTAQLAIGAGVVGIDRQRQLHGDLVSTGQVCVSNLGIWHLKGRPVLHIEDELGL